MNIEEIYKIDKTNSVLFIRNTNRIEFIKSYFPETIWNELMKLQTISEYKHGNFYINYFNVKLDEIKVSDWEIINGFIEDFPEIVLRCRGLRSLSYNKAKILVLQTFKYFIDFFKKHTHIKNIYSIVVDSFVMDIMFKVANYFNVNIYSFVRFFVKGYFRVTKYGEINTVRIPENIEVNYVIDRLRSTEKSFMAISLKQRLRIALPQYFKSKIKYLFFVLIGNKILNKNEWRYRFCDYKRSFYKLNQLLCIRYFKRLDQIKYSDKCIFIPLHYYPEATVDYWLEDLYYTDYENSVYTVASYLSKLGYDIIIKEHPAFVFQRDVAFYSRFKNLENVFFVDPYTNSQEILNKIDKVIVWTGSVGLEALAKNKEVYIVSENYYSCKQLPSYTKIADSEYQYPNIDINKLMNYVLSGTIPKY